MILKRDHAFADISVANGVRCPRGTEPRALFGYHQKGGNRMTAVLDVIAKDDLTIARIMEIYKGAYIGAEIGADGDIKLELEGLKVFVKVDPTKKILRFYSLFGAKPEATRQQMLELCNRINDGLVLLRASCPAALPHPALWLDHDLDTEAGLTGLEIVDETRRFRTVFANIPPLDTDHILA